MKLSENIRSIRKEHRLTQERLAEAMGVSAASVSKWETGQSEPELTMLGELADFFGVSVDALMGHTIRNGRMDELLAEMTRLGNAKQFGEAKEVAEKLLRRYPNSYRSWRRFLIFTAMRSLLTRTGLIWTGPLS